MNKEISLLKGIHPGIILERELQKRGLSKEQFALSIREYPQTLSAIITGKRSMNTDLALRIEEALGMEEGFFMCLQHFYDIKQIKLKRQAAYHPDLSKFRRALFWDTDMNRIDWQGQKRAIINRVFERGAIREKKEIVRFYGHDTVAANLKSATVS